MINGTQAEYVHIPHADGSLYVRLSVDDRAVCSQIFSTSYEIKGPPISCKQGQCLYRWSWSIGLAALLTVQFFSTSYVIMVDLSESRLRLG